MKAIQTVPLQQIDLSDETFSVNFMPDLHRLRSSIEEMGLIQPVLLRKNPDGYQIVCGFRRISIMKELGGLNISSTVLGEEEKDDLRLFSISLNENLTTRGFNTVEKAIALNKLVHQFHVNPVVIIKKYLPLFDLEPDEKILKTYFSLARMEEEIQNYVLKEEVSRTNIRRMAAFSSEDRSALLSLISPLKLGENRLREILTFLEEITKRDKIAVQAVVRRPEIRAILSHQKFTPSQKTERIKNVLMDLRYPRMHRMVERFEKKKRDLNLPPGIFLSHSPFFEGKGLKIEFQFETMEEYQSIVSFLSKLQNKKEFQEMILENM